MRIDLAYSTVTLDRPAGDRRGYLIGPTRDNPRGGTVVPIERGRWLLTLFGMHGAHPPTAPDRLRGFADRLPTPVLADLLGRHAMESSEVRSYPFPSSRWHRYDRLERGPDGLLVIGDAVASFNPIYGQGMSVAALSALELHRALATSRTDLADRYFDRLGSLVKTIWRITVGADFELPGTTGPKPRGTDLFNWYLARVVRAAHDDGVVTDAFARVLRLETKPIALLHPRILARTFAPA